MVTSPAGPCITEPPPVEAPVEYRETDQGVCLTSGGEYALGHNLDATRRWMRRAWIACGPASALDATPVPAVDGGTR